MKTQKKFDEKAVLGPTHDFCNSNQSSTGFDAVELSRILLVYTHLY